MEWLPTLRQSNRFKYFRRSGCASHGERAREVKYRGEHGKKYQVSHVRSSLVEPSGTLDLIKRS